MIKDKDSMLVCFSNQTGKTEDAVLIVGKKRFNGSVKIVNAFQGEEAAELYKKLITKKENSNE